MELRKYVVDKISRDDVLFLGIFEKSRELHIGNIKYEPVNSELGYAIMGILIGDADYRGKGVASEVLLYSIQWLNDNEGIHKVFLGVDVENKNAIRAYEKSGFIYLKGNLPEYLNPDIMYMVKNFS